MTIFRKTALAFLISFVMVGNFPLVTHAAFNLSLISSLYDGKGFSYPGVMRDYTDSNDTMGPYFWQNARGQTTQICAYELGLSGLPDTNETYCAVDQVYFCSIGFGNGFWGSGGGNSGDSGGICRASFVVNIVQKPSQQWAIATLENNLRTYFSNGVYDPIAGQYVYSGSDPGYRDYCQATHADGPSSGFSYSTSTPPTYPPDDGYVTCDIYHQNGTNTVTASLSASPSTISSGSASALTYSCTNATSASIDNGVGTVSVPTGTVGVTPGATTSYTLTCTNASGSATAQTVVTVTPGSPDLVAAAVTPSTATVGTPVTLTSTVSNTGAGSTGAAFTDLFQRATDASGSGVTDIGTYSNATLANGANTSATLSYTFPSAATWYVRVCADKSSAASMGIISESNEVNNCGAWTAVNVTAAAAPSCTFTGTPTATVPSTLTWSCVNVTSCTGGGFSTGFGSPISGSKSVAVAGTYTLSCTGPNGSVTNNVTVGAGCSGTPTGALSASQTRVRTGTSVNLTLTSISNVKTSCVLSGPGVNQTYVPTACTVPGATVPTPAITTQSVYTLTCDGVKVGSVVVNVLPNFTEF